MSANKLVLLDMGSEKFGDAIFCQFGVKTILIDGGHPGDASPNDGHPSLPAQIKGLTGKWPLNVDLLVVTHCHRDHIGCLPALVDAGLTATWALVADPDLGWGKTGNLPDAVDAPHAWDAIAPGSPINTAVTALFDDSALGEMSGAERDAALSDLATLEDKYRGMIAKLKANSPKTKVVRYGVDAPTALVNAFKNCGLKILGPSKEHLKACADYLAKNGRDAVAMLNELSDEDAAPDAPALLDRLLADERFAADGGAAGAALNNQSIVLRFLVRGKRVLLPGDMQLAKPGIATVNALMPALRQAIKADGPYDLVKTSHHTSDNGLNTALLADWGAKALFAHSGGLNDATHPDPEALADLQALNRPNSFARTDRNGQIALNLNATKLKFKPQRPGLNNFESNSGDDESAGAVEPPRPAEVTVTKSEDEDRITVTARIPRRHTRVTLTVEIEPLDGGANAHVKKDSALPKLNIADGRALPRLLFVTSERALGANLGPELVRALKQAVPKTGGQLVTDLDPADGVPRCAAKVQSVLKGGGFSGVVLLGGYDVVPAARLDVLTPEVRAAVAEAVPDADDFIVWSDALYADVDGNTYADLPVSRIPDARSRDLFLAALQAGAGPEPGKLCVHNVKRPFATTVFPVIPGNGLALASDPAGVNESKARQAEMQGNLYLMLHGDFADGSTLWGEDQTTRRMVEAFDLTCLPARARGVIFTGACWGALIVTRRANAQDPSRPPQSKLVENSLALAALRAGYRAFIGCTGSHYSPLGKLANQAGGPLHALFWDSLRQGAAPAAALFAAKREYEAHMPYLVDAEDDEAGELAVDQKILRQFTCLGLGW